ncbi:redoxin domain-containing protein [Tenacibaculum sp. TC6]|uniref:redoxin domain-containing protein n=1 Tax=Tenacibaculum sp. TC6 TaxID=3423223 RepID=UPI003D36FBEE
MKKIVWVIILLIMACQKEVSKNFILKGTIDGIEDGTMAVLLNIDEFKVIDSVLIEKGKLQFSDSLKFPFFGRIVLKNKKEVNMIDLWVEKGDIVFKTTQKDIISSQGGFNPSVKSKSISAVIGKYNQVMQPIYKKQKEAYQKFKDSLIDKKEFEKYTDDIVTTSLEFCMENPNNYFSVSKINEMKTVLTKEQVKQYYDKLTENLKESPKGKLLKEYIEIKPLSVGNMMIDIEGQNLNGETVKLSNFKGKVIVLDFWAAWCPPCVKQMKNEFPKLYEKYGKEVEIVSFSFDKEKSAWEKLSKELAIKWVNISNLKGMNDNSVARAYNVNEIPTSFIIGKDGRIIKRINYEDNLEEEIIVALKEK